MIASRKLTFIALVMLLPAAGAGVWREHRINRELLDEMRTLKEEVAGLADVWAEHGRLKENQPSPNELRALHNEHEARARILAGNAAPSSESGDVSLDVRQSGRLFSPRQVSVAGTKVAAMWGNAGSGTPESAIETQSWAFARGDIAMAAGTIALDDDVHAKIEKFLSRLTPENRDQFPSPEFVMATVLDDSASALSGIRLSTLRTEASGDVIVRTLWTYLDGHARESDVRLRKSATGWQRVISDPDGYLESRLQQLSEGRR